MRCFKEEDISDKPSEGSPRRRLPRALSPLRAGSRKRLERVGALSATPGQLPRRQCGRHPPPAGTSAAPTGAPCAHPAAPAPCSSPTRRALSSLTAWRGSPRAAPAAPRPGTGGGGAFPRAAPTLPRPGGVCVGVCNALRGEPCGDIPPQPPRRCGRRCGGRCEAPLVPPHAVGRRVPARPPPAERWLLREAAAPFAAASSLAPSGCSLAAVAGEKRWGRAGALPPPTAEAEAPAATSVAAGASASGVGERVPPAAAAPVSAGVFHP